MNALKLRHDLKARGVNLEAEGESLKVDAPAGVLTDEDRALLLEAKPALLLLCRHNAPEEGSDDGRRFDARPSKYPGYTSLYDPVEGRWHDFPTQDCFPSITAPTSKRRKGGTA